MQASRYRSLRNLLRNPMTVLAWAKGRKKYTRKATGGAPGRHRRGPEQLELPLHGDTTRPVDEVAEVPCRVDNMP